jgi:hypothetical protein
MRLSILLLALPILWAQPPDPAREPLAAAYRALAEKRYEEAISLFLKGLEITPGRAAAHKDLAYT